MRASSAARSGVGARLPGNPDRDGGRDAGISDEDMRADSTPSGESSGVRSAPSTRKRSLMLMQEGGLNSVRTVLIEKSLFVLTADNPIRKIAIKVCFHRHFDRVVMGVIALNCVFLAMDSKAPGFADTARGKAVEASEPVFLALFCVEMLMKITATGFRGHPNAYLADNWNRMDFFVVILGVLAALDLGNFSAIRVVRVLRPLRTLQGFAGMRRLVVTLLRSMPLLFDVAVLVSFLFFTFGLVGVQLYSGAFTSRCSTLANAPADCSLCGFDGAVDADTGCDVDACAANVENDEWTPRWVATDADETCGGASSSKWPFVDNHSPAGYKCPAGTDGEFCHDGFENPNYGITSFDNVADAWLTIFQCISLEGWTDVMYYAKDAVSPWSWVYFTSMIIMGAFFAVNLALAVLFVSFVDGRQAAEAEREQSARGGERAMSALLAGEDQTEESYQEIQLANLTGRLELVGTYNHGSGKKRAPPEKVAEATAVVESAEDSTYGSPPTSPASVATPSGIGASFGSNRVTPLPIAKTQTRSSFRSSSNNADAPSTPSSPSGGRTPWLDEGFEDITSWVLSKGAEVEDVHVRDDGVVYISAPSVFTKAQRTCRRLATSQRMASLTMFLIIANTILMASEFHGMPNAMAVAYEIVNYVITSYFALEMAVKLVGLTPRGYVADKFNIFDGVVVIVSVVELIITSTTGDGGGMLSALRTGRLLRVFKLARSWPQLRNIITTILATIPSMSSLAGMLLLFIFIFDLLGMQLFGYQFIFCDSYGVDSAEPLCPPGADDCPTREDCYAPCPAAMADFWVTFDADTGAGGLCKAYADSEDGEAVYYARLGVADRPRHHFDDFFWAFITIFQVLTGEDWNAVMYDAMRTVGSWACLYFIAIVVIGNYVVLNLFLAILLDNFSGLDTGGGDGDQDARHAALVELKQAEKQQEEKERRREARKKTEKLRELEKDAANVGGDERRAKAATRRLRLSAMRKSLESFVTHRWFEKSMLFMIVLSSCLLAVDSPVEVDKDSRLKYWLDVSDVFFVGLFVLEAALKIVALGKRYFKNGWNVLDFCIVSLGVASAAITALADASDENAAVAAKILRAFRALRPLRIASRSAGMKVVISALFSAVPAISNVALVCILFYLIFGILGLNLFMGRMHRCVDAYTNEPVDPNSWGLSKGELTKTWCKSGPRLITCVDDRRVAVFAGGDNSDFDQNAENGFGWQCVSSLVPSFADTDWTYSSYGGGWTCTASDATRAVLDGTNRMDVGSTFGSAAVAANDAVAAAVATATTTGVLESSCEPVLFYLDWKLPRNYDFDHIGTAMLVLFETATLEMWLEVMYHGVDATETNVHPWRDANPAACVFFVVFIIVGSFFIMNLFVGVTIDKFNEMKEESAAEYEAELNRMRGKIGFTATGALQHGKAYQEKVAAPVLARGYSGSRDVTSKRVETRSGGKSAATIAAVGAVFVTEEQRRWQQVEKMLMQCKPRRMLDPPPKGWRTPFYRLTNSNEFDAFIGILITLNVGVMCMTHAGESTNWSNALFWANAAFAFVFLIEACMKLIGFGVAQYFHDAWNKFDAFVVSLSIAGFALETFTNTKASYLAILRVFRVVRVLRLVKRAKGLQTLLQTLVFSLPALFNVASVLFLFFFIYAVMGMNLFGMVRAGEVLGRHAHFQNFPDAMATLFRSATGERWNGIMHDCMTTSECIEILTTKGVYVAGTYVDLDEVDDLKASPTNFVADTDYVDRCTPNVGVTVFYFVSFILLCGFVMLNLVIAVILDNFESYSQSFALPVSEEDFGEFAEEWSKIDRRASYYMKYEKLPELLRRIRAPLGIRSLPKDLQRDALRRTMFTFDVEVRDGNKVHFVDVLKHLASRVDGVEDPEAEERARSRSERLSMSMSGRGAASRVNSSDGSRLDGADGVSGSGKRNAVHPLPRYGDGTPSGTDTPDGRARKGKPSLLRQMSGSFVWRSSKKSKSFDDDDLDDGAKDLAPPLVCHHFAAIHVQTMWKGKLARRQVELRKLKKKKRSMRRRKAEGQSLLREQAPASPGNPTSGDDSNGDESHDED